MAQTEQSAALTDTDILIDGARGLAHAVQHVAERRATGVLHVSVISAMELVSGCRDKAELARVQQFLASVRVLPITEAISRRAYELMVALHLAHGLALPDAIIAATAIEHGLALHTRNVRHYRAIPSLTVEPPY